MSVRARSVLAAVATGVLLLSGCSSTESTQALDPDVVHLQPGAPGEGNEVVTEVPVDDDVFPASPFSEADVAFMRDMQVHHGQALEMTALVEERTDHADLRLLARRMDVSQQGEVELLDRLLAEHEEAARRGGGADHDEHDGGHGAEGGDHAAMPGMLGQDEMAALEAARGDEFVRLFLVAMSRHHEGALAMVADLFATDGAAADPRLSEFAQHVDSDQRIEIDRMARIYAALPAT